MIDELKRNFMRRSRLIEFDRKISIESEEHREVRIKKKWAESRARYLTNKLLREIPLKVDDVKRDKL